MLKRPAKSTPVSWEGGVRFESSIVIGENSLIREDNFYKIRAVHRLCRQLVMNQRFIVFISSLRIEK